MRRHAEKLPLRRSETEFICSLEFFSSKKVLDFKWERLRAVLLGFSLCFS